VIILTSYADLKGFCGSSIRLRTFWRYLLRRENTDVITICCMRERLWSAEIKIYKNDSLLSSRIFFDYSFIFRILFFRSFNIARIFKLNQMISNYEESSIYVHSIRCYQALSQEHKKRVCEIDACDDNTRSFRAASAAMFAKRRYMLAFIFWYESHIERRGIKEALDTGKTVYFISSLDCQHDERGILLPIDHAPEFIGSNHILDYQDNLRFGVIGNFRTVANKSIVDNLFATGLANPNDEVFLFGLNVEQVKTSKCIRYGQYKDLKELTGLFDVGVCLVDVQGGIQCKVVDYLCLGKVSIISSNVANAFSVDSRYSILLRSPLLLVAPISRSQILEASSTENQKNNKMVYRDFLNYDSV